MPINSFYKQTDDSSDPIIRAKYSLPTVGTITPGEFFGFDGDIYYVELDGTFTNITGDKDPTGTTQNEEIVLPTTLTDYASYFEAAIAAGKTLRLLKGDYPISRKVSVTLGTGQHFRFVGEQGTRIVGTFADDLFVVNAAIKGSVTMGANANAGDNDITAAFATDPVKGDILRIYDATNLWTAGSSFFYKGEIRRVLDVPTAGIPRIHGYLDDSYNAATTTVETYTPWKGVFENIEFVSSSQAFKGLKLHRGHVALRNVGASGGGASGIELQYCTEFIIDNGAANNTFSTASVADYYGLTISSCERGIVIGGHYGDGEHGVTVGGLHPVRDVHFIGVTAYGHPLSSGTNTAGKAGFDAHQNSERCSWTDCVGDGFHLAGRNHVVRNCTIQSNEYGAPAIFRFSKSGSWVVDGLNIIGNFGAATSGLEFSPSDNNVTATLLSARNLNINGKTIGLNIRNNGYTGFSIDKLNVQGRITGKTSHGLAVGVSGSTVLIRHGVFDIYAESLAGGNAALIYQTVGSYIKFTGAYKVLANFSGLKFSGGGYATVEHANVIGTGITSVFPIEFVNFSGQAQLSHIVSSQSGGYALFAYSDVGAPTIGLHNIQATGYTSGFYGAGGTSGAKFVGDVTLPIALSDEVTNLATGTGVVTMRIPFSAALLGIKASVGTAPVGSTIIVDMNEGGSTVLSTKLSIDASEKTSATAAVPPVISDRVLAADAEITFDIDQVGSTTPGKGLKVYLELMQIRA